MTRWTDLSEEVDLTPEHRQRICALRAAREIVEQKTPASGANMFTSLGTKAETSEVIAVARYILDEHEVNLPAQANWGNVEAEPDFMRGVEIRRDYA